MSTTETRSEMIGGAHDHLDRKRLRAFLGNTLGATTLAGKSVCAVVPDATRTCPLPFLVGVLAETLADAGVRKLSVLIALGTHAPMASEVLHRHVGFDDAANAAALERIGDVEVINHAWHDPNTFVEVGSIGAEQMYALSQGRLDVEVPVRINRAVVDHDLSVIVGPVMPHEVVGFSGGNKYLFPGISGQEMIDVSHWLGALIGSAQIIGTLGSNPVRDLIDAASTLVPREVHALCVVTDDTGGLHAASFGDPLSAWRDAAQVAAQTHIRTMAAPVATIVSVIPERYDDLWTGAKGFYKVEPIVADGGRVILYAPHISQLTPMHPGVEIIGYHCAPYFTKQWAQFANLPWGELAHSTHLRGAGTWDPVNGERPRVQVTLASGVSRARTERVGLDWMDPCDVDLEALRADPNVLVVPDAGEVLYRLA